MKRRELLWMLLPCLLFAGIALWLRPQEKRTAARDSALEALQARQNGPFELIIEKVEKRLIPAQDAFDGYDTYVIATLGHKGKTPAWWGKISGDYTHNTGSAHLFRVQNNKATQMRDDVYYWRPSFLQKTNKYEARFLLKLRQIPRTDDKIVLRANVAIEDARWPGKAISPIVPLNFVVRQPRQIISMPAVSRDPQVTIRKIEIKKLNPARQNAISSEYAEVQVHLLDMGNDGSNATNNSISVYTPKLVDDKGRVISPDKSWNSHISTKEGPGRQRILVYKLRLKAFSPKERTVIYESKVSCGRRWPLSFRVPLRRNGQDLSGIVTALPERSSP
ncbi:MAG TPA: hypothetical protein VGB77_19050 [Abditibacteriaceae bacterium]|jgi:hypothetical protein